jgi:4-amino-4-deoxy-L-arabinose transferase-like glycosyltransferase
LLAAVTGWFVLFWRIGDVNLMDDEAHYARLTLDMGVHPGWERWLVPRLGADPFIDKPPLFHWLQGVTTSVVADPETGARLPSALAAVSLVAFVAWLGARLIGAAGWQVWALLLTVPATLLLGRTGYLDMVFTAALFGAVGLLTAAGVAGGPKREVLAGTLLGLAVLTKGPVAFVLVGGWLLLVWLAGNESRAAVRSIRWSRVGVFAVAVGAPWFLWMFWRFGALFISAYLGAGHVWYFTPRASASSYDPSFYLQMFVSAFFPWSLIALGYGVDTLRAWRRGSPPPLWERWMWLWMLLVIAAFTVVPFRVDRYIYPAAPACCLLALRGWRWVADGVSWRQAAGTLAAATMAGCVYLAGAFGLWEAWPRLGLGLPDAARLVPVLMGVGGVALFGLLALRRGGRLVASAWPVAVLALVYVAAVEFGSPALQAALPVELISRHANVATTPGPQVGVLGLDRWEMGLRYYLASPPERLRDAREAQRFMNGDGPRVLITRREWSDVLLPQGCRTVETVAVPAVVGTRGRGFRSQVWADIVVLKFGDAAAGAAASPHCR